MKNNLLLEDTDENYTITQLFSGYSELYKTDIESTEYLYSDGEHYKIIDFL